MQNKEDRQAVRRREKTGSYESHFNFPSLPLETKSFKEHQITLIVKLLLDFFLITVILYTITMCKYGRFLFVHNNETIIRL